MKLLVYDVLHEHALFIKKQYECHYNLICCDNNKRLKTINPIQFDAVLIKINTIEDVYSLFYLVAFYKNIIVYCTNNSLIDNIKYLNAIEIINGWHSKENLVDKTNNHLDFLERNLKAGYQKVV